MQRLIYEGGEAKGLLMFVVAAFGLMVNIVMAFLLGHDHKHRHRHGHDHDHDPDGITVAAHHHGHNHSEKDKSEPLLRKTKEKKKSNINVHSAYLHVLGDSLQSVGVMIGGAIIWYMPEWYKIDNFPLMLVPNYGSTYHDAHTL